MKKLIATMTLCIGALALPALAQAQTAQQSRMATCNKQAEGKSGEARKAFMKECLAGKEAAPAKAAAPMKEEKKAMKEKKAMSASGKELTPQQQRMSFCSKDAKAKGLKGEERKKFMSQCLKKK